MSQRFPLTTMAASPDDVRGRRAGTSAPRPHLDRGPLADKTYGGKNRVERHGCNDNRSLAIVSAVVTPASRSIFSLFA